MACIAKVLCGCLKSTCFEKCIDSVECCATHHHYESREEVPEPEMGTEKKPNVYRAVSQVVPSPTLSSVLPDVPGIPGLRLDSIQRRKEKESFKARVPDYDTLIEIITKNWLQDQDIEGECRVFFAACLVKGLKLTDETDSLKKFSPRAQKKLERSVKKVSKFANQAAFLWQLLAQNKELSDMIYKKLGLRKSIIKVLKKKPLEFLSKTLRAKCFEDLRADQKKVYYLAVKNFCSLFSCFSIARGKDVSSKIKRPKFVSWLEEIETPPDITVKRRKSFSLAIRSSIESNSSIPMRSKTSIDSNQVTPGTSVESEVQLVEEKVNS